MKLEQQVFRSSVTQPKKRGFFDPRLSLKAKGMLGLLLYATPAADEGIDRIFKQSKDGRDATRNALNELIRLRYVLRDSSRETGQYTEAGFRVSDTPFPESEAFAVGGEV